MYQELINIIGVDPQQDLFGFLLCVLIIVFFLDKVWTFLYSIFSR